jgi:radical SAM protein with 4Fe4S-binding SPASM domain
MLNSPTPRPNLNNTKLARLNINPDTNETLCISCNLALACQADCSKQRAERADPSQGPDGVHLRPLALHVLWAL